LHATVLTRTALYSYFYTFSSRPPDRPTDLPSRAAGHFVGAVQGVARRQLGKLYLRTGTIARVGEWSRRSVLECIFDGQGSGWWCGRLEYRRSSLDM
jgi:hypothetical protein